MTRSQQFDYRLLTLDSRALSYIMNSSNFERPVKTRRLLSELLGVGIFSMEGKFPRMQNIEMLGSYSLYRGSTQKLSTIMIVLSAFQDF